MKASNPGNYHNAWKVYHVASGHQVSDIRVFLRECLLLKEQGFDVPLMAQNVGLEDVEGVTIESLPTVGVPQYRNEFSNRIF